MKNQRSVQCVITLWLLGGFTDIKFWYPVFLAQDFAGLLAGRNRRDELVRSLLNDAQEQLHIVN